VRRIGDLLAVDRQASYSQLASKFRKVRDEVAELISKEVADSLNGHLDKMPQETRAQKQELCRWLNAEMRSLGIAIRCPKTGEAAMLHVDPTGQNGRFQIELIDRENGRKRTLTSVSLPTLTFRPHLVRREPLAEYWAERVGAAPHRDPTRRA
jgi:hypothetical protein